MKKVLLTIMLFSIDVLMLSFAGCSAKEKIEESVAEKITEKIMESASDVDVDVDGDVITMTGNDGQKATFGSTEWPKSEMAKSIPEFKGGEIVGVMEADNGLMVVMNEVKEDAFNEYLEKIKKDYTEDILESKSEGVIVYYGVNGNRTGVYLTYNSEIKELSINLSVQEE